MKSKNTVPPDVQLFAEECERTKAELRSAIGRIPAAAGKAANPIAWFRRYPVATCAVALLGAGAVYWESRSARQRSPGHGRAWMRLMSRNLLAALRQSLTAALATSLTRRGAAATPPPTASPVVDPTGDAGVD